MDAVCYFDLQVVDGLDGSIADAVSFEGPYYGLDAVFFWSVSGSWFLSPVKQVLFSFFGLPDSHQDFKFSSDSIAEFQSSSIFSGQALQAIVLTSSS